MTKIIFILSVLCLMGCKQEVKLNQENHLHLFNLKGKVKQVNYSYILNEITDITYKPIGKANPRFLNLGSLEDTDISYTRALSNFDYYYSGLFFDSFNISVSEIIEKSYEADRCDNYQIKFNEDGFITNYKGFKDNSLIMDLALKYEDNKLVSVKRREYSESKEIYNYDIEYEYNDYNLIAKIKHKYLDGYTLNSIFEYTFNKSKNEFSVVENKTEISDKKYKISALKYYIILDKENNIQEILHEKDNKSVKFINNKIKKVTEFNKNNELTFNIEIHYSDDKISDIKKTKYGNLNEIRFEYEENGNLNNIDCNDENKKGYINNLKFNYEFDELKNWTKQTYAIDRTRYDNYLQYLKKREKYSNDYYERYGYSLFSLQQDAQAEIERKILSKYSSKIDVERRIIYY